MGIVGSIEDIERQEAAAPVGRGEIQIEDTRVARLQIVVSSGHQMPQHQSGQISVRIDECGREPSVDKLEKQAGQEA